MPDEITELDVRHLVSWPWPVALLAHVTQQASDSLSSAEGSLLFISPTAHGLDALESSEQVMTSLWVLAVDTDGPGALLGYRVEEITSLHSITPGERQLTVLSGPVDRLIAIEGEDIFVIDRASSKWKQSGPYKRRTTLSTV